MQTHPYRHSLITVMKMIAVRLRDLYSSYVNKLRIYFHIENNILTFSIELNEIMYKLKLNLEAMRMNHLYQQMELPSTH